MRALSILITVILFALLAYWCIENHRFKIQQDVGLRTVKELEKNKILGFKINADGRDITIEGSVPEQRFKDKVGAVAASVYGVRVVNNNIKVKPATKPAVNNISQPVAPTQPVVTPPKPVTQIKQPKNQQPVIQQPVIQQAVAVNERPEFKLIKRGNVVTLSGIAPNAKTKARLLILAKTKFAGAKVIDNLKVSNIGLQNFDRMEDIAVEYGSLLKGDSFVRLFGNELSIGGQVSTEADLATLKSGVTNGIPTGYVASFDVSVKNSGFTKQMQSCQNQFNKILSQENISFASGKATIKKTSYNLLSRLIAVTKTCPNAVIRIEGHTDSTGSAEVNSKISRDRAVAVAKYLKANGAYADRLIAIGYGSRSPIASNDTAAGRAKNRRIEFNIEGY